MTTPPIRQDLFGLSTVPFLTPPLKPFLDEDRQTCLDALSAFTHYRGFAALSGRPGCGKTALVHYFTQSLHPPSHKIMYLACGDFSGHDLLRAICCQLELEPVRSSSKTLAAIEQRLKDLGALTPILVLDEMQNASNASLELLRLLAASRFDSTRRLCMIMIGTDSFLGKLALAINESLRQRITYFHRLSPLDEAATATYLTHCLNQAGAHHQLIPPEAVKLIHDLSGGALRLINTLALAALAAASREQVPAVTLEHLHQVRTHVLLPKTQFTL